MADQHDPLLLRYDPDNGGIMKKLQLSFIAVAVVISGCGSFPTISEIRRDASSGYVGCAPRDVDISDNESVTWTATCRGKQFYCSATAALACTAKIE
jgi:hypothetical protein